MAAPFLVVARAARNRAEKERQERGEQGERLPKLLNELGLSQPEAVEAKTPGEPKAAAETTEDAEDLAAELDAAALLESMRVPAHPRGGGASGSGRAPVEPLDPQ